MAKKSQEINIAGENLVSGNNNKINEKPSNKWVRWVVAGVVTVVLVISLAWGYNQFGLSFWGIEGRSTPTETPDDDG